MVKHPQGVIAVIAHAGAGPSIADWMPRWRWFGLPVVGFVPKGEIWPGDDHPEVLFSWGKSAHRGPDAFRRLWHAWVELYQLNIDFAVICEPDCVPLRKEIPEVFTEHIGGWICSVCEKDKFPFSLLPPWTATRATLKLLAERCGEDAKQYHPDCLDLTDRWVFKTAVKNGVKPRMSNNVHGYVWHTHIKHTLRQLNPAWAHGWKTEKQMKEALS